MTDNNHPITAALAKPEPEGLTDEQLLVTYARALTAVVDDTPEPWSDDLVNRAQIAGLRAVLARWGNRSAPQPVPVSEPPGPEDCDTEGRCWWLNQRANPDHDLLMPTWHFQRQGPAGTRFFRYTHWLPANALPLPEEVA